MYQDDKQIAEGFKARLAKLAWTRNDYTQIEEVEFFSNYSKYLSRQEHLERINYLLAKSKTLSVVALNQLDSEHKVLSKITFRLAVNYKQLDQTVTFWII